MAWRVVIAGGGFGGLYAARRLERLLPPQSAQVTLVADANFLLFSPLLPGAAAGTLEPRHVVVPLREELSSTDVRLGQVTGADPDARRLDFVRPDGMHIKGLSGIGSEKVVLKAIAADGEELALMTYWHILGYHIREIAIVISEKPMYDVDRLNRKLFQLVGDDTLDEMTAEYDRVFSSVIRILYQGCTQSAESKANVPLVVGALSMLLAPSDPDALPFLLATPMMKRRLEDLANLTPDPDDPASMFVHVNGPNFPIDGLAQQVTEWAKTMLKYCADPQSQAPFEPATLSQNPVFVWGAAVTDGFFTDEELPRAVAFIKERFGRLPTHPRMLQFLEQITAIATLMACTLKESELGRLMKLCGMLGFMFDVHDRDGRIVGSSMRMPG